MEKITIIIPHYNSSRKVERLLKSIFCENYTENIEVILVDDNSSDIEKELLKGIIAQYTPEYPLNFFENETDRKGAGVCRNIGIENSNTKWLLFADADDYFLEDIFTIVNKYIDQDYDVIFFKPTSIYETTKELSNRHIIYSNLVDEVTEKDNRVNRLKIKTHFLVPWSKMISRKFIKEKNILFEEVMYSNDIMFASKIAVNTDNFFVVSDCFYCVTSDNNTLTTTMNKKILQERLDVSLRQDCFYRENLSKTDYKLIRFQFIMWVKKAIVYKFGIRYTLDVLYKIIKNRSKLLILKRVMKKVKKSKYSI